MPRAVHSLVLSTAIAACGGQTESSVDYHGGGEEHDEAGVAFNAPPDAAARSAETDPVNPVDEVPPEATIEPPSRLEPDATTGSPVSEPEPELPPIPEEPEPTPVTEPAMSLEPEALAPSDAGTDGGSEAGRDEVELSALQRYWLVGGYSGQIGDEEMYWHFLGEPEFEYVHYSNLVPDGPILDVSPGTYALRGRTLSVAHPYHRYRFDVALGTLYDTPALMTRVYSPLGESSWRVEFAEESVLEDGTVWRSDAIWSELVFDVPLPSEGSGECEVQAEFSAEHFELMDAMGAELPEGERVTRQTGTSEWIPCRYEPGELGQMIELVEPFFADPTAMTALLAPVQRTTMWLDPEQSDVLFMDWFRGSDELPEYARGL